MKGSTSLLCWHQHQCVESSSKVRPYSQGCMKFEAIWPAWSCLLRSMQMAVIGLCPVLIYLMQVLRPHRAHALAMTWQGIHTSPTSNLEGCHLSTNSAHGTCSREPKCSTISSADSARIWQLHSWEQTRHLLQFGMRCCLHVDTWKTAFAQDGQYKYHLVGGAGMELLNAWT